FRSVQFDLLFQDQPRQPSGDRERVERLESHAHGLCGPRFQVWHFRRLRGQQLVGGGITYLQHRAGFGQQDRQCDQRSMAPMAMARVGLAAATVDGKIYAIGGFDSNSSVKNTEEVHDPACTSPCPIPWTAVASMPTARAGLAVIPVDGKIYAIGGRRNNSAAVNLWKSMIPVP